MPLFQDRVPHEGETIGSVIKLNLIGITEVKEKGPHEVGDVSREPGYVTNQAIMFFNITQNTRSESSVKLE